jgi:hypothetical protein
MIAIFYAPQGLKTVLFQLYFKELCMIAIFDAHEGLKTVLFQLQGALHDCHILRP